MEEGLSAWGMNPFSFKPGALWESKRFSARGARWIEKAPVKIIFS